MTQHVLCSLLLLTGTAAAQERQPAADVRRAELEKMMQAAGQMRAAVEMRTTAGAPYSGESKTEFMQVLADGNRITRKTVVRIFRDSEGRVRREHLTPDGTQVESITIVDPVAATSVLLDPEARTVIGGGGRGRGRGPAPADIESRRAAEAEARKQIEAGRTSIAVNPVLLPSPAPGVVARSPRAEERKDTWTAKREDLGQRSIEGVMARGTRTTTLIPAGAIGNEQPIRIVSEEWFSPELQLLVLTKHSDPRSGETTYSLSNIVRAEPDRSLFEVPPDYTRK